MRAERPIGSVTTQDYEGPHYVRYPTAEAGGMC